MVLLVNVCAWLAKTKVSLAVNAGIVARTEDDGATALMVVVLVVPKTTWFDVAANPSAPLLFIFATSAPPLFRNASSYAGAVLVTLFSRLKPTLLDAAPVQYAPCRLRRLEFCSCEPLVASANLKSESVSVPDWSPIFTAESAVIRLPVSEMLESP